MNKPWTQLLGTPQNNEMAYGKEILRQTGPFEFVTLCRFKTGMEAKLAFEQWLDEN